MSASVSLAHTFRLVRSAISLHDALPISGARFTSVTVTVKLFVALKAGTPLSVTVTLTTFVLGPCASLGVQLITPLAALIVIPVGALTSAKVSVLAGRSASVALALTLRPVCSSIVWLAGTLNTGARFTSVTVTVKLFVALKAGTPLSVTLTLTTFVLGPCASLGVQLITPLAGLMLMPRGALTNAKVNVLAGRSASVALALTDRVVCSSIV